MAAPAPIQYGQYSVPVASECVNFGVGQPAPSMLPLARVRAAAAEKLSEEDPLYLQYGYISGYPAFRAALAGFLAPLYGKPVDAESLFITNGISGALALLCGVFLRAGDVVVVEEPSYFLALNIFRDAGMVIVPMPIDAQGLDVDALERALAGGLRPKLLYTIPCYQNPTSFILSDARRTRLVALAAEYDFIVAADEVYQLLGFEGEAPPPPPLCYYDTAGKVLSMGSFAKILAPAMRLGWLQAAPSGAGLLKRVNDCGLLDSSGNLNPLVSGIVHAFIARGDQAAHLAAVKAELTRRAATLGAALRAALPPGASFLQPRGGYFIWVTLPAGMDGAELLARDALRLKLGGHLGGRGR